MRFRFYNFKGGYFYNFSSYFLRKIQIFKDNKASIVVGVSKDLTAKYNAVDLVRAASAVVGGQGGGGRPDMAQAGGSDAAKINDAIAKIKAMIA